METPVQSPISSNETSNISKLQSKLHQHGVDALLVTNLDNVRWSTGFTGSYGVLLVSPTDAILITDSRYTVQAAEEAPDLQILQVGGGLSAQDIVLSHVATWRAESVHFESDGLTYAQYDAWKKKFGSTTFEPKSVFFESLRMIKSAAEIEKIRAACKLADTCFAHVQRLIQPGVQELDIAIEIEFYLRRQGAAPAFDTIAVSGVNSARPHGKPTEKKLEVGDYLTIDFGARLNGYCSDMTRTVLIGEASPRHREIYEQVLLAQTSAIEMMKPGARASDIDMLARTILAEKELDGFFGHSLGHGLGSVVHDYGSLSSSSQHVLEEGQVWTVEPGVYIEGFGGLRIEDDVVVTADGVEILNTTPKELLILP